MLIKATKIFDHLAMFTIASYCLSFIAAKFIFNPGGFPIAYFVIFFHFLGLILIILGIPLVFMHFRKSARLKLDMILALIIFCIPIIWFDKQYGWLNINFIAANDYSTDVESVPQFSRSKHDRLHFKEVQPLWRFLNIPHKVLKAPGIESISLDMEPKTASRLVKRALVMLGWPRTNTGSNGVTIEAAANLVGEEQSTDLVIRILPKGEGGSLLDVRSSSRAQRRDLGSNMVIIRKFIDHLDLEIAKSKKALN